jgi:hypothetical protein
VDQAWASYARTILDFPGSDLSLDLRQPIGSSERSRLAALGLPGPFAVVTACNPLGRILDPTANQGLTRLLSARIRELFPGARPATGRAPDRSHAEEGWALPISRAEAERLAAEFLQNALYWYDGAGFTIVPVLAPGAPLPLPVR